jgi:hypothetical protein
VQQLPADLSGPPFLFEFLLYFRRFSRRYGIRGARSSAPPAGRRAHPCFRFGARRSALCSVDLRAERRFVGLGVRRFSGSRPAGWAHITLFFLRLPLDDPKKSLLG